MVIEEPRTSSVPMRVSNPEVAEELAVVVAPVVRVGLAELVAQVVPEALAEPAVQVARVVPVAQVEPVAREALAEPVSQVVQEALAVPVALAVLVVREVELELNREVELPLGPVEAEPAHARVAVQAPRTKSVTVAHHRGLVPALKVEDLAVAAQTTREPAAAEAAEAWAVAE